MGRNIGVGISAFGHGLEIRGSGWVLADLLVVGEFGVWSAFDVHSAGTAAADVGQRPEERDYLVRFAEIAEIGCGDAWPAVAGGEYQICQDTPW